MLDFGNQNEKTHRSSLNHMLLVAGIHGNEAVGPELLLQISNELCESYGKDSILTKVLIALLWVFFFNYQNDYFVLVGLLQPCLFIFIT